MACAETVYAIKIARLTKEQKERDAARLEKEKEHKEQRFPEPVPPPPKVRHSLFS